MQVVSQVAEVRAVYSTKIPAKDRVKILRSKDTENIFRPFYENTGFLEQKEVFSCLYLDRSNKVLGIAKISEGSNCATVVDAQYIFRIALLMNASQIILCHNHPSCSTTPSDADKQITRKIVQAGEFMEIKILDHIILTSECYLSFADEGLL